ncbi:MAG: hypothetical protein ACJA2E_000590 [Arenicella sp.]|jgi:hypothetical protein
MNTQSYLILADAVLLIHVLVVVFVILGLLTTLVGGAMKWRWVTNPWFRLSHLICIGVVVTQAWAGVACPLTRLEMWLRSQAGQQVYSGSFISHWLSSILYYDLPAWVFTLAYTSFGGLVLVSWLWVKPRSILSHD